GTAQPADFSVSGTTVTYGGPNEWSFRRLILHYALLCKAAGGVEGFLIGSEMRGLTWVRDSISSYPFVSALVQLAADVKSILGAQTKIAYAADWSEYFGHQPSDGSGDVHFHLDPLWSSPNIDAIGIDMYWPLSDWRDGAHLDRQSGAQSIHDLDYLKSNIRAGEGYDWYYASSADRDSQVRTPITDGLGKPWVFRFKNVWSWWQSQHFDRPGGIEVGAATAWTPQSKPIWISETGCPAVDKGANQPNVFWDPKSSESFLPYYSRGVRDDLIQRRYVQALYEFFDPSHEDFVAGSNPNSVIYGGPMVDVTRIYVYAWDARPYPAFPFLQNVWTDGENWTFGHWLTGRVSGGPVSAVVRALLDDYGFNEGSSFGLTGVLDGYVIDRIMSARQALQPLELAYFFDSVETGGQILFRQRGMGGVERTITRDQLVEMEPGGKLYQVVRGQETELPNATKVTFIQGNQDYRQGAVESRRLAGGSARVSSANLPIVMGEAQALGIAEVWLHDTWLARERTSFALPPSLLALEPGDLITLQTPTRSHSLRITGATVGQHTEIDSRSIDPDVFLEYPVSERQGSFTAPVVFGPTLFVFLDLPIIRGNEAPHTGYAVAYQSPWPGGAAFFRSPSDVGFQLKAVAAVPATFGVTASDFFSGPTWRYDRANSLTVVLHGGALSSTTELGLLGGANMAALQNGDGEWEVIQFLNATLVDTDTYALSVLLRGQAGSEYAMREPVGAGATIVLLDDAVVPVDMVPDEVGLAFNWRIGPVGRDIGHSSYSDAAHAFSGVGLRPLSPVHVQSEHQGTDLVISWMRRTRIAGDSWNTVDVPLGEDIEGYEIEILNGASVKRTLSVDQTTVTYSEADQIADWGTPQASYQVRVFQMSATRGRGAPQLATV
ncbi:MAG: glycoside hydrolase/phage tail family protein, partial [Hyphomicrobiaceae bacterium]